MQVVIDMEVGSFATGEKGLCNGKESGATGTGLPTRVLSGLSHKKCFRN